MEFTALASSSRGCCYRLSDGRTPLLLECGLPLAEIRRGVGFRLSEVAGVLVSHEHMDHARAAADLTRAGVEVYASEATSEALGLRGRHRLHYLRAEETVRIGTWRVLPWDAVHDVPCLGFLLASDAGDRVLYATDTAYIPYRFEGLTVLAVECNHSLAILRAGVAAGRIPPEHRTRLLQTHMALERLLEMLQATDLSAVREIHLLHLSGDNSDAEAFRRAVAQAAGRPVYVAPA